MPAQSPINSVQIEFYFAFLLKVNNNEIIMIMKSFFRKDISTLRFYKGLAISLPYAS